MNTDPISPSVLKLRIGISMRTVEASDYVEGRDVLAHNWDGFLHEVFRSPCWVPVPNSTRDVKAFCEFWHLNGFILSGGNDSETRDHTEFPLIRYALDGDFPLLGVCHGLQTINRYFGGDSTASPGGSHAGGRHLVRVKTPFAASSFDHEVNSYHDIAIAEEDLAKNLEVMAECPDGTIEGAIASDGRLAGIMWHPEREETYSPVDLDFFRKWFGVQEIP